LQTITSSPSQSSSNSNSNNNESVSGGGGGNKVNIAGIVGGLLGALVLIVILLAVFLIWLPRRQKKKAAVQGESGPVGGAGSIFVPAAASAVRKGGGRAELQGGEAAKGTGVGVGEKEVKEEVVVSPVSPQVKGAEMDGQGEGKYGLRPEELDSEGRYVGELHGDGRQFGGVELEGSEVVR
jgi:hypothetical protein